MNPFSSRFVVCVSASLSPFLIPRQLHNPYLATPLSIASYRMATRTNVMFCLGWIAFSRAFVTLVAQRVRTYLPSFEIGKRWSLTVPPIHPTLSLQMKNWRGMVITVKQKLQNTPLDMHLPLELIAKLSIDNNHIKGKI